MEKVSFSDDQHTLIALVANQFKSNLFALGLQIESE